MFLAGKFLFVRSDTFAVYDVSFSHKTHRKKTRSKRKGEFFQTQATTRALLTIENSRRSTSRALLVLLEWIEFGCVRIGYCPEESDYVPAVRVPRLVTETGLIVLQ